MKKKGRSIQFHNRISILEAASVVGPKEGEGPLGKNFDVVLKDILNGEDSWEKGEGKIVADALALALQKSGRKREQMDYVICGDLLNQSVSSTFGVRKMEIPFFGVFGACSTMGEAMTLAAMLLDGDFAQHILVGAASHFCAAEKQFRFPLELGSQRTPTASWTVTGCGAAVLAREGQGPYVTGATTGIVVDMGVTDVNNMAAAMAPAAADTLAAHFKDSGTTPADYDLIVTGDLGHLGRDLVVRLMRDAGYDLTRNYTDCGIEIFDREQQDTRNGGSGCACSAVTLAGYFFAKLRARELNKILFIPTGALMSQTSVQQGETIPGIAHAVVIEN
jgi:stage V sporulation protein AD